MDFGLDEDQEALRAAVAALCADRWPIARLAERPPGLGDQGWSELAGLGVPALLAGEDRGGLGLGVVEATVVSEELGAHLVAGPMLWSTLAATLVDGVAGGDVVAAGLVDDGRSPAFVQVSPDPDVVLALRASEVAVVDASDLPLDPADDPLDPLDPVAAVDAVPAGRVVGGGAEAVHLRQVGTVLAAAHLLGVSRAALDVAVEYSKEREQFGVPIGSFQALQHLMADMYVRTSLARSSVYAAAAVIDDPAVGEIGPAVSAAKLLAGDAALRNARVSVQVLGGMGFTWDMAPNFLLKRAWALDFAFGTPRSHALSIADALAEEAA